MDYTVFTIGYSGFSLEDFVHVLKENGISLVIDVRSTPYSQYHVEYNKENIKNFLMRHKIHYRNYAEEFGARQDNRNFYPNGYLDFELFSKSTTFLSGIEKLMNAMKQGYIFALMCSEIQPVLCHRANLVARAFYDQGCNIIHLLPKGAITQMEMEEVLLEKYFPERNQLALFSENFTREEYIREAYKKQNANIGYRINGGD